ncbi:MAG: universal stress protein [Bacteroidota bacterium]|nr:universal stress protein [Bacteroidota bacterium]
MKKILVAIDFSEGSINALEHALVLAKKNGSDIIMVWVNPDTFKFLIKEEGNGKENTKAETAFESLWKQYNSEMGTGKLEYVITQGQIYEEIVKIALVEDVDLLVCGTHGVSGFSEFWMGSTAFRLIMASSVPVLSVQNKIASKKTIDKILLPIDSTIETRQKIVIAVELAKKFDAEIHVLSLYTTKVEEIRMLVDSYSKQTVKYAESEGVKCILTNVYGGNITNLTLDYADEISADLIVIMTEQEISTMNLWMGTYAKQMVNHSKIPVLSIKPKELIKTLSR